MVDGLFFEFLLYAAEFCSAACFLGGREGFEEFDVRGGVGSGDFGSCGVVGGGDGGDGGLSGGCACFIHKLVEFIYKGVVGLIHGFAFRCL